eukprot:CAMPEP_0170833164 /NCGR_PEP_ID=MMETSP0734-20130129/172_1 /TAXON_ID=186038 /ORGANISM="Fragilariopsis kerguelensis, Strain L26-C5" /LENGTH=177 /DNA_ID=CAMNT_0011199435 /DNA_START=808 /DNA_END=1341 /DNA_ORIENTATION=+
MTTFHVFDDIPPSRTTKRFNGINFIFFHLEGFITTIFDNGYTLAGMDLIRTNRMSIEIPTTFDTIRFIIEFDFITFHDFLNGGTNIGQTDINAGFFDPCIGRHFDSFHERIVFRIEMHGKRGINNPSFNLDPEIQFHHIIVLKDCLIPGIRGIMGGDMIQGTPGRKTNATFQALFFD